MQGHCCKNSKRAMHKERVIFVIIHQAMKRGIKREERQELKRCHFFHSSIYSLFCISTITLITTHCHSLFFSHFTLSPPSNLNLRCCFSRTCFVSFYLCLWQCRLVWVVRAFCFFCIDSAFFSLPVFGGELVEHFGVVNYGYWYWRGERETKVKLELWGIY